MDKITETNIIFSQKMKLRENFKHDSYRPFEMLLTIGGPYELIEYILTNFDILDRHNQLSANEAIYTVGDKNESICLASLLYLSKKFKALKHLLICKSVFTQDIGEIQNIISNCIRDKNSEVFDSFFKGGALRGIGLALADAYKESFAPLSEHLNILSHRIYGTSEWEF